MSMFKEIKLWEDNPQQRNNVKIVRADFNYKTSWCVFNIEDLRNILREWIKGEEEAYPQEKGFKGR